MRKWLTGVRSAGKLFVHLRTKLSGVNRRGFPLDSTGSVPAEVAFWKLLCTWKFSKRPQHETKFSWWKERYSHLEALRNCFICYWWYTSYFRRVRSPAQNQELLILLLFLVVITAGFGIQRGKARISILEELFSSLVHGQGSISATGFSEMLISALINCQLWLTAPA